MTEEENRMFEETSEYVKDFERAMDDDFQYGGCYRCDFLIW